MPIAACAERGVEALLVLRRLELGRGDARLLRLVLERLLAEMGAQHRQRDADRADRRRRSPSGRTAARSATACRRSAPRPGTAYRPSCPVRTSRAAQAAAALEAEDLHLRHRLGRKVDQRSDQRGRPARPAPGPMPSLDQQRQHQHRARRRPAPCRPRRRPRCRCGCSAASSRGIAAIMPSSAAAQTAAAGPCSASSRKIKTSPTAIEWRVRGISIGKPAAIADDRRSRRRSAAVRASRAASASATTSRRRRSRQPPAPARSGSRPGCSRTGVGCAEAAPAPTGAAGRGASATAAAAPAGGAARPLSLAEFTSVQPASLTARRQSPGRRPCRLHPIRASPDPRA